MPRRHLIAIAFAVFCSCIAQADEPLHKRIDALIAAKANGPVSTTADDAEFLRRAYLDFAGRIPTPNEARSFLRDKSTDKRLRLIDRLLKGAEYPVRMAELFNVVLMERLGEHAAWTTYLQASFKKNKPWDQMAREMLRASSDDKESAGAAFFISKRLENYGQNPVDYPALTRDIGRLFLGKDMRCAQCHDHLFIEDYKQRDFQGLFAFVKNVSLRRGDMPAVSEKLTAQKIEFVSVFGGKPMQVGPLVPGLSEIAIPKFKKGEEFLEKPDRKKRTPGVLKFSTLAALADHLPVARNKDFNRNIVNRLWFVLMGRGLVHPLDLHHSDNAPSHPKLLDLLADEFVAHKYDIKWMLRELALTQSYQRSSELPKGVKKTDPKLFQTAVQRRLSAEQVLRSTLQATGEKDVKGGGTFKAHRDLFLKAFANSQREPEEEFAPTLKAALFLLNNETVLGWLKAKPGNLTDRLAKLNNDRKLAEELYLTVLTRLPLEEEVQAISKYLAKREENRAGAVRNLSWALFASTEFCVNH